ncbi:hypothetical protein IFM89_006161 [Coptis chinensis]|uniref:Syntaxin N-terminal domain-containing protein n=1 Tax=Coptis chinensis TaxID=261450 RepID=A0A835GXW1_9MAGN|nr:hypothetical protein IFM89_006161 [Coptis chinensis]
MAETPKDINVSTVGSPIKDKIMEPEEKLAIPDIHNIPVVKIKRANDFYMEYAGLEEQPINNACKTRLHIGRLVKDTTTKLKQASEIDQYTEVSASKKIDDAKLAKDFQAALKEFQKAQRLATERETSYSVSQVLPPSRSCFDLMVGRKKVRSLIEDIRDVRFHKVETGFQKISARTHAVKVYSFFYLCEFNAFNDCEVDRVGTYLVGFMLAA